MRAYYNQLQNLLFDNKRTELLKVNGLRCWHKIGIWPFNSFWLKAVNEVTFSLYEGQIGQSE